MTCTEFLAAAAAASWGSVPLYILIAVLAVIPGVYLFKRAMTLEHEEKLEGEREFWYKAGVALCVFLTLLFIVIGLCQIHNAVYPESDDKAVYYCADHPPVIIKKAD